MGMSGWLMGEEYDPSACMELDERYSQPGVLNETKGTTVCRNPRRCGDPSAVSACTTMGLRTVVPIGRGVRTHGN